MFRSFSIALSGAALLGAAALANAQTLSAADILARVEQKVGGVNEYQALLNDPDPNRSMAAMEVMLDSGDSKLVRMALDYGIYSPNPVVQRMALEGFFASAPNLSLHFSGTEAAKESWYTNNISNYLKGSVDAAGDGFASIQAGKYDPEKKCYARADDETDCFVSLSDAGVSIVILKKQGSLKLNDNAELIGTITLPGVNNAVTLRIPVSN
ncbi:MAG: hypothetical protein ACK4HF_04555 [Paracoccaceae bacterium]